MRFEIQARLKEIEQQYRIRIMYACESGSRAWGFPSPDSDFDVRFIYLHAPELYLSITTPEEHMGFAISDGLDVYGWDLKKVLRLMRKSNVTPFEWLQSPIVYSAFPGFRDELWDLCRRYFSRRANIRHYLGIARGALCSALEDGTMTMKKIFYVLRPLLAAKWCLANNEIAPMSLTPLLLMIPDSLREEVFQLIALKAHLPEAEQVQVSSQLSAFMKQELDQCNNALAGMTQDHFCTPPLDRFFKEKLTFYDIKRDKGKGPFVAGVCER